MQKTVSAAKTAKNTVQKRTTKRCDQLFSYLRLCSYRKECQSELHFEHFAPFGEALRPIRRSIAFDSHTTHGIYNFIMAIDGKWYNELGSSMTVKVEGNTISGTYHNDAGKAKGDYNFVGVIEPAPSDSNQALAWVVTWVRLSDGYNAHSVTAWSGQYQSIKGVETITSEWLLTAETDPNADWASTLVGHDVFTRVPLSPEAVERRLKLSAWSHPKG